MSMMAAAAAVPSIPATSIPAGRVQRINLRAQMLWTARFRVLWIALGFVLLILIALVRIASLGLVGNAPERTSLADALLPPRGEITDRNGVPLARAFPAYALWFDPSAMGDKGSPLVRSPENVARDLKAIFPDIDETRMAARLASGRAGYLRRRILPEEANKVFALGEVALEIPRETDRHYPQGTLAAHALGYVVEDEGGKLGMEQVLDARLSDPDLRGEPVALSLDVRVQGALEDELRRGMLETNAIGAAGIVLDVDSGEVMAMASLPEFDPNVAGASGAKNVFNRVTNGVYELGSTFKPLSVAAAMDAGVVRDLGRAWNAEPVQIGRATIKDLKPKGATLNVPQALVYSSNTVTARVADELGPERLRRAMIDLGMDARPFIELPARGKPLFPRGNWSRITNMTVSYGHGLAVTPLHLASAYAAMVNGGIWRPATLMKLEPADVPRGRRVFKESTSSRMRQMLRMISLYGTGRSADAPGYRVGGKTGSAEKNAGGVYKKTTLVSSFAAAFPLDAPRYVVVIVVDEPKGTVASSYQRTAAFTAAPVVGRLVPRIGPMLGIHPDERRDVDISDLRYLVDKH
ncbi:cell division protein FtsI (penicillin-binding protein 3) [Erythrobacter sanguineus]|uniref:Cell division protein FtsI (Penicillin-binding protein 3) n=2 Tax=Erythrobacter sanguineus TaxID=198312 RepID=A0A1M7RPR2_9SPHN|nr:penicillin-binding protein 2 [Erythrobacter sanguineus]SHN48285.1 cell division protein FtsI (penicillin-binding protein 3) [Erythrobacter sanguineus]